MTLKPETFDTFVLTLGTTATDLTANTTLLPVAPDIPAAAAGIYDDLEFGVREAFIQCIEGGARWRESDAAPAAGADGHVLNEGDGVVVTLVARAVAGRGFWVWPADADETTKLAISPAAGAPVRETRYDVPTEAA
ncbi:MAG: hypothetical protein OXK73_04080 [Rhodospirillaceae bacterium]|nr:hypothetical protein [Rhodospirillaceae bacterium]